MFALRKRSLLSETFSLKSSHFKSRFQKNIFIVVGRDGNRQGAYKMMGLEWSQRQEPQTLQSWGKLLNLYGRDNKNQM